MAALLALSEVVRLDSELVRLGRGTAALRLAVGEALEALSSAGGHHELGFSSFEAYARERCERTGRWAADTRALARKLRNLPLIRQALCAGTIGWSTAELLARHVTRDSEGEWLERARRCTVRELRALLAGSDADVEDDDEEEPTRALTVRVTREDAWMFEGVRKVVSAVAGTSTPEAVIQALLAEGCSTLLEVAPEDVRSELHGLEGIEREVVLDSERRDAWRAELGRLRREAEAFCERHVDASFMDVPVGGETDSLRSLPREPEPLDREIRRLCAELSERDLMLGIVAESARKAEVWRRLGFATEAQYVRERVGISLSSLKAKRILAARSGRMPELGTALATGRIGYEAAYLLSRVATPATVSEWIGRAECRTLKHLREEVDAAELLIRTGQGRNQRPPDEACLAELFELERAFVSGDVLDGVNTPAGEDAEGQKSGGRRPTRIERRFGRVTLRWMVKEQTQRFWRAFERVFTRVSSRVCRGRVSFVRFLCETFLRIWLPALRQQRLTVCGEEPAYYRVYRRDAFRCTSPVCSRRDLTPHHLRFRSHGGGDEDENVASLCVWCHLRGVHGGRIRAEPPASRIRWRIGRSGTLRIDGRTRVAA